MIWHVTLSWKFSNVTKNKQKTKTKKQPKTKRGARQHQQLLAKELRNEQWSTLLTEAKFRIQGITYSSFKIYKIELERYGKKTQ